MSVVRSYAKQGWDWFFMWNKKILQFLCLKHKYIYDTLQIHSVCVTLKFHGRSWLGNQYLQKVLKESIVRHFPGVVKCPSAMQETGFDPWVGKITWRRKWQPTPVFLPGKSHGPWSLVGYRPWGRKESETTEWLHFTFLLIQWLRILFPMQGIWVQSLVRDWRSHKLWGS